MSDEQQTTSDQIDLTVPVGQPTPGGQYTEMLPASTRPRETFGDEEFNSDHTGIKEAAEELSARREPTRQEAQAKAPVERAYQKMGGQNAGQRMPSSEAISAEQGAHDLESIRGAEQVQELAAVDDLLRNEIDGARGQQTTENIGADPASIPVAEQQPIEQQGADPEVVRLIEQNPKLAAALRSELSQRDAYVQAAAQFAETTRQQYTAASAEAANLAVANMLKSFPELQGRTINEIAAALPILQQTNPERAKAIVDHLSDVGRLAANAQQVAQQQNQAYQAAARQTFDQGARAADAEFDRQFQIEEPSAERRQGITAYARQMLRDQGLDDRTIAYHWETNPLLRSVQGQRILADAARYRMSKTIARSKAANPVPIVQKPGSPLSRTSEVDYGLSKLGAELTRTASPKSAAAYLTAKRAAARGR